MCATHWRVWSQPHSPAATATIKFVPFYWSVGTFNLQQCPPKKKTPPVHAATLLRSYTLFLFFLLCFSIGLIFFPKCLGNKKTPEIPPETVATSMQLWCRKWTILKQQDSIRDLEWTLSSWCFFLSFLSWFSAFVLSAAVRCTGHILKIQMRFPDGGERFKRELLQHVTKKVFC